MRQSVLTPLSRIQREIIVGSVLGDGCLEFNGRKGTRLQIKQCNKYKKYVFWLYCQLKNLCNGKPKQRKDTNQWYFSTRALKELTYLHSLFYQNRRKLIPKDTIGLLKSPLTLAVWYMDDGSLDFRPKDHYAFTINTNSFSLRETKRLSTVIQDNFGVKTRVHNLLCRKKRYPRIYIGRDGRKKFLHIVKPWILSCFSHKLPPL